MGSRQRRSQVATRAKQADALRLTSEGLTRQQVVSNLGIGVASVYRMLAESRTQSNADGGANSVK